MASKSPVTPDLTTECWTCAPLEKYVGLTKDFTDNLSAILHDPMLILFGSLCGLWIVVSGLKLALKMTEINQIIKDFVYITITGVLLGSQATSLIPHVYSSVISIMGASSASVFSLAGDVPQSTGYDGIVALAANGEKAVAKVFQAASAIAGAGALYELANYVYAFVLIVPYFLLVVAYSSQVVVAIFRATMIAVFAPFLSMAFAFGWGRGMAMSGIKTLLASILVLFASTAALALTIFGVNGLTMDPTTLTGNELNKFASVSNPDFLVILFLGWAGTALMTEGTAISNSISHTFLTNAAAGIMTAGATGSAMLAGTKGVPASGNAAAAVSRGYAWGQRALGDPAAAGAELLKKFQTINTPGGSK